MANQHVMTLENSAGLLITPEMLEQIGVSTGDQIEISVSGHTLIVRSLTVAETEKTNAVNLKDAKASADEATVTIRELINEELAAKLVEEAPGVEVTLTDGRKLLFHNADDLQLDEVVKRVDVREVRLLQSARAGAGKGAMDKIMLDLLERRRAVYEKLAEGAQ